MIEVYHELSEIRDNYMKEYECFVENADREIKTGLIKYDKESIIVFEMIYDSRICSKSFFNTLCNYDLM